MTFTPDRKRRESNRRARRAEFDSRGGAGRRPKSTPNGSAQDLSSLKEQLKAAGLDLTGHPFAEVFDALDPVPTESLESITADASVTADDDADAPAWTDDAEDEDSEGESSVQEPTADQEEDAPAWEESPEDSAPAQEPDPAEPVPAETEPAEDVLAWDDEAPLEATWTTEAEADDAETADIPAWDDEEEEGTATTCPDNSAASSGSQLVPAQLTSHHPLLPDSTWSDLADCAPEMTGAIAALAALDEQLRAFDRPMGPNEALHVIDGAEALRRLSDSLSVLALSVYERVGTPTDSGAKTPKDLIQSRLNLTGREANRRARLAENLGGRVTLDGQRLEPQHPLVAEQFHAGTLSAEHITALEECLKALPAWVDQATRTR